MTEVKYDLFAWFEGNICTEMYHVPEPQWEEWKYKGWIQAGPPVGCPGEEYYRKRND